jgi:hypothetical protein
VSLFDFKKSDNKNNMNDLLLGLPPRLLSPKKQKSASVAEMIHRFRTAPPTSKAVREAMRQNGDAPTHMWYEEKKTTTTSSSSRTTSTLTTARTSDSTKQATTYGLHGDGDTLSNGISSSNNDIGCCQHYRDYTTTGTDHDNDDNMMMIEFGTHFQQSSTSNGNNSSCHGKTRHWRDMFKDGLTNLAHAEEE